MANSKNLIIGLLVLIVVLLTFLIFRPMMYGPAYNQGSYQPGYMMGPGMMHNPGYNYTYGSGMMGNMMAVYYSESKPIAPDEALKSMQNFARQYSSNTEVEDFMVFSSNYYAALKDSASGQYIAEVLVDRYSGSAYPEPGPNMMWNTQYGAGRVPAGGTNYNLTESEKLANDFLTGYLPGAKILETKTMPGYYTFDFGRKGIEGMLSVNAYNGQIWMHTWHGFYIGDMNTTS